MLLSQMLSFSATMFVKTNKDIKEHEKLSMIFFVQSFLIMLTIATLSFLLAHRPVFIKENSPDQLI